MLRRKSINDGLARGKPAGSDVPGKKQLTSGSTRNSAPTDDSRVSRRKLGKTPLEGQSPNILLLKIPPSRTAWMEGNKSFSASAFKTNPLAPSFRAALTRSQSSV